MQPKTQTEDLNPMPQITAKCFCDHIDEVLERIEKDGISYRIIDEESGASLVACPVESAQKKK